MKLERGNNYENTFIKYNKFLNSLDNHTIIDRNTILINRINELDKVISYKIDELIVR
jgi:hypothetical protein